MKLNSRKFFPIILTLGVIFAIQANAQTTIELRLGVGQGKVNAPDLGNTELSSDLGFDVGAKIVFPIFNQIDLAANIFYRQLPYSSPTGVSVNPDRSTTIGAASELTLHCSICYLGIGASYQQIPYIISSSSSEIQTKVGSVAGGRARFGIFLEGKNHDLKFGVRGAYYLLGNGVENGFSYGGEAQFDLRNANIPFGLEAFSDVFQFDTSGGKQKSIQIGIGIIIYLEIGKLKAKGRRR